MRLPIRLSAVATALLTAIFLQPFNIALAHGGFIRPPHHRNNLFGGNHHHFTTTPPATPAPAPAQSVSYDNVMTFGAKGDGTTDDTAAITAALADAKINHKTVFLPIGKYYHAGTLIVDSVPVTGADPNNSILLATNKTAPASVAVVVTGLSASLTNLTVSTTSVVNTSTSFLANEACVSLQNATGVNISNATCVQGNGVAGVVVLGSSVSAITSCAFDGNASTNTVGVWINASDNITVTNNLFQAEGTGVAIIPNNGLCQFINVSSNAIGNTSYPTKTAGIAANDVNQLLITQNVIQMANVNASTYGIFVTNKCANVTVTANQIDRAWYSIYFWTASGQNSISQNTLQDAGAAAMYIYNYAAPSAVVITNNNIGEVNIASNSSYTAVIGVVGSKANLVNVLVQNNSYQGHLNHKLKYFVFGNGALNSANVSGNTETQTTLIQLG